MHFDWFDFLRCNSGQAAHHKYAQCKQKGHACWQAGFAPIFILVGVLIASLVGGGFYLYKTKIHEKPINSYEDCIKKGNPTTLSYPATCRTKDGRVFVQELSDEEKKKLKPSQEKPDETVYTEATRSANWKTYTNKKWNYHIKYPADWEVLESSTTDVIISSKIKDANSKADLFNVPSKQLRVSVYKRQKETLDKEAEMIGTESLQCTVGSPCKGRPPEELINKPDGSIFAKSVSGYYHSLFPLKNNSGQYLIISNNYPWTNRDKDLYEQFIYTFNFLE